VTNDSAPSAAAGTSPSTRRRGTGRRVLLVEDHRDTLDVMSRLLTHLGFDVTGATTVAEATAKLDEPWEIVVSDLGLPDGSGLTIARSVRAGVHQPRLMVALSGHGTERDIAASRDAGFDAHLVKPITLADLAEILGATSS
jgi:DNA-binding response OmpR family regulator